ncbi:brevican core protein triforce isoform X2 [Haematobia irritans]|uniref:brevican core protein triforce isoform X2 n=1 Tax=Haematobia irritans TaxID=7368 RepID=UPI003F5002DF
MKPFLGIILIIFALANGHSDGHKMNSPSLEGDHAAHHTMQNINIKDINNIAVNPVYTSNAAASPIPSSSSSNSENNTKNLSNNNNDSDNTFIVTPMPTKPSSEQSSSSSSSPSSSTNMATHNNDLKSGSNVSTTKSSSSTSPQAGLADVPVTIPTPSTLRDKRDTNFGLDQSEIARQNQITQQLLSSYLERRLFPNIGVTQKIPTIVDILPKVIGTTTTTTTTTTAKPKSKSLRRPRPRGFSVTSPSFKRGSNSSLRKTYGSVSQRKTPNSLQELLKLRRKQNDKQPEEDYEEEAEPTEADPEEVDPEADYDSSETDDGDDIVGNKTLNHGHSRHHHQPHHHPYSYRDELDEEDEYRVRTRYRPYNRYRHHHGYHRHHYDDDVDQDGQEALQSVESEQHDHYYKTKGDIFSRDPSENEIDSDCPHCVDETQYMNKWTMPLLKLGEKRYYLGIFFKANWFKATQYCRYHGMHLASISSQEENDRLEKHIKDFGLENEHFWVSGTDLADEGNFFWLSTGRPITFTNWNAGEPNNYRYDNGEEENCLELWNRDGKGLKWNDSPCSFETYFVCEAS